MDDPAAILRAQLDDDEQPANPDDATYAYGGILPGPHDAWSAGQADAARVMKARILEILAEPYALPDQPEET